MDSEKFSSLPIDPSPDKTNDLYVGLKKTNTSWQNVLFNIPPFPYTYYVAFLQQSGTNPPQDSVIYSDFNIKWSRSGKGVYVCSINSNNKVYATIGRANLLNAGNFVNSYQTAIVSYSGSTAIITINTYDKNGSPSDDSLYATPIEIRSY
jgi:hypothetical protein